MAAEPRVTRFKINWGDQVAGDQQAGTPEVEEGSTALQGMQDTDSMLGPMTSSFKDVHSMDESSNVEMEMAF